jgi:Trk K+ transport system NAD-binding subunit
MSDGDSARPRFVVCGDNPLAYRVVEELVRRFSGDVAVVLADRHRHQGPALARLPGVRLVESSRLDEATLADAGVAQAQALALVDGNDADTIHAGLAALELNPTIRLVLRTNPRLGSRIRTLFPDCVVLSASQMAAPSFVAAALGEDAPSHIELDGTVLYTARRAELAGRRVVCGLADTTSTDPSGLGARLLPADPAQADLVLAHAEDTATPLRRYRRSVWLRRARYLAHSRLVLVLAALVALILLGLVLLATVLHRGWGEAVYETFIDAAGEAQLQPDWNAFDKTLQIVVTFSGLALLPTITAVAIDRLLRARLADRSPDPTTMDGHVVVVGLGNVGARVLVQLHDLGIAVVGVDVDENARGVAIARGLTVPVVLGDATWWDTLRTASVGRARAMVLLTSSDVTNLEAALLGRTYREDLRVVLRLFDDDLAERVERRLGIAISRSVSRLAAPSFAAAMVERQVLGTISVGRAAVMIAEVPVAAGSSLVGAPLRGLDRDGGSRVLAVRNDADAELDWSPDREAPLAPGQRVVVAATRAGLGTLLASSISPDGPERTRSAESRRLPESQR